ncbi:MAG: rRNA maturation RNase YbeY [Alphaproteobacteria bacterium]|nr:rRNA maturation RNase YbeY [Alphaproteobacteria bacterium]
MPPKPSNAPIVDLLFDSPLWGKSRLGCRALVPSLIALSWKNVPDKPKGIIPEVTVTLTDDSYIQELNRDHRSKDKPTNVLSFPNFEHMSEIPSGIGEAPIGDIIVAFETVKRESIEQGKTFKDHLSHMIVHGFLHLLGYDHISAPQAEEMEALEVKILKKLDIPNPYN